MIKTKTVDVELSLEEIAPRWVEEATRFVPFGPGNPRPTIAIRRLSIEVKSPRVARLSDGTRHVAARGPFTELSAGERYDVLATPELVEGELVLTVSDVKGAAVPEAPARI